MKNVLFFKAWLLTVAIFSWLSSTQVQAAELNLGATPLFLGSNVDPNVFFELDDSGSMDWETLTFDYHYYTSYWRDTNEPLVISGVWENVTNESVATTSGGGGRFRFRRGGGGGGGGGGYGGSTTTGGDRKEFMYMFDENDRLYQYSGSMTTAEDHSQSTQRDWRARSVDFNLLYYNPETTYTPWNSSLSNATFSAARSNPQSGTSGYSDLRDLDDFVFEVWKDDHGYDGDFPDGPDDATDDSNGEVDLWDSHIEVTMDSSTGVLAWKEYIVPVEASMPGIDCTLADAQASVPYSACYGTTVASSGSYGASDINPWGRNLAQEQQNIANWYSFYRKRSYVAKGAVARVMASSGEFRYGMSLINAYSSVFKEVPASSIFNYATHNSDLLSTLFSHTWQAVGTPLRRGLERVGQYFDGALSGKTDPIISECQQNFSILLTDGFWNGSSPASAIGNADGDTRSITVADVSKYYYDRDLSSLPNNVPTSVIDSNNEQHMVTFTVAFGLRGALEDTDNDGYPNPFLAESGDWGNPFSSDNGIKNDSKIDDLWHAAYNSKGWYIQAQSPDDVVNALNAALSDITDRVGSSASVATNSGSLNAGSHLFQARFDSGGWSGQLIAFAINSDATLNPVPSWEASTVLDTQNFNTGRTIITFNPDIGSNGKGVPFRYPVDYTSPNPATEMSSSQASTLLRNASGSSTTAQYQTYGEDFVNYLRGDRSNELIGQGFRLRNSALGDIVDSDPKFVGIPRFTYPDNLEAKSYSAFKSARASRTPVVYVGSNDGMLHGFSEETGQELLSYVPNAVFYNLPELGVTTYLHKFFVNEASIVVDAYFPLSTDPLSGTGGTWKSVLAGGLGAGGQGVYALNVTDPSTFSEANAGDIALWEFDDSDDSDLGYSFGEVQIAKMQNGKWAAVFSNGYNNTYSNTTDLTKPIDSNPSTTGNAYLFVVDIETGALIRKIDTGSGTTATPNGLSTPSLIDFDGDSLVDYIYAGDLLGQVWKFDMTSANEADWDVANIVSSVPTPLFTTINSQPITSPIQVTRHPEGRDGYMLFFGSGKYLELTDNSVYSQPTQAFYGIWDKDETVLTPFTASNLVQQRILDQFNKDFDTDGDSVNDILNVVRKTSKLPVDYSSTTQGMGWYINLLPDRINGTLNIDNVGEKQVSKAVVRDGRVIFTTVLPSAGACDFGGSSFTMSLDYTNGGELEFPPFDLNGDGQFDDLDTQVSGVQSDVGIVPTVSILSDDDRDIGFASGSSGAVEVMQLNVGDSALGRQSWREIR